MNRKLLVAAIIAVNLLIALVALQLPVDAAPDAQRAGFTPTPEAEPLAQPLQIRLRQQIPATITLGQASEEADGLAVDAADEQTVAVVLDLDVQFMVTQTLTTTVPATLTLSLTDGITMTVPFSLLVGEMPSATLVVTPLAPLAPEEEPTEEPTETSTRTPTATATEEDTPTATSTGTSTATPSPTATATTPITPTTTTPITPTATATITPTATFTPAPAPVSSTVNITSNLRAGPGTDFAVVGQAGLGQPVTVVAISADGLWYLLDTGQWIAAALVTNPPPSPPIATDELIASIQAQVTPTSVTVITGTTPSTATTVLLPTATAIPPAVQPSVTVNANLRSGPGTDFPILGGTITGQPINIVARNEAGDWFLLDNGGWVFANLVANAPNIASVPVFNPNQPAAPTAPVTATAPITATAPVTGPAPVTPTTPTTSPVLGVRDFLYLENANELIASYEETITNIDSLLTQAGDNVALLQDQNWIRSMATAIAALQSTNAGIRALEPTPALQAVHDDLQRAAEAYENTAELLTQGVDQRNPELFTQAFAQIALGNAAIDSARQRVADLTT
jgi:uncharacterized protein YraI